MDREEAVRSAEFMLTHLAYITEAGGVSQATRDRIWSARMKQSFALWRRSWGGGR